MKTKSVLIGCGAVLAIFLLLAVAVGAWFWHVSQDPVGITMSIDSPDEVKRDQVFDLKIEVVNNRAKKSMTVTSIDIHDEYLQGFVVISQTPPSKKSQHVPVDDSRSFDFNVTIPAGQTNVFIFKLRAVKAGVFSGDVDVCEGQRFLTDTAQTEVK